MTTATTPSVEPSSAPRSTPPSLPSGSPWLDLTRRPQRRHLLRLQVSEGPVSAAPSVVGMLAQRLRETWAAHLGLSASAILPCASASEALRLVANAVLLPGDTVRMARPGQLAWSAAVLSAGAAFVDVGRLTSGAVDPSTRDASPAARLVILGAPAPTGAVDACAWPAAPSELRLADATLAASLYGQPSADADLSLVVLRDPDAPASPLLAALCGAPDDILALQLLAGPSPLPERLVRTALAVTQRIDAAGEAEFLAVVTRRAERLRSLLTLGPGQQWLPRAGVSQAVACLAADGQALATAAQPLGYSAEAWGAFPGGGLVRCDLLA